MMKKVWPILLVVVLVFGLVVSCGGGGSKGPGGSEEEELVDTLVFDMETDARIQGLELGAIPNTAFASGGKPIAPLQRAGEDEHIAVSIVDNDGKNAIQYQVKKDTWGVGIDLPYSEFGFREGDEITVVGTVLLGTVKIQLNCNVGSENAIAVAAENTGDFELHVAALTSSQANQAKNGDPAGIRIEARAVGVTVQINNITVNGLRPANIKTLDTPVVTATETGVAWEEVEGASGYKVFVGDDYTSTVGAAVTSFNINIIDEDDLAPGIYSVSVVALGVSGSSRDSAKSTAVSFTKAPLPTYEFTLVVDGEDQVVQVKGVNGGIEVLEDGNGFTFTKGAGYASSYAWFGVTFDEADKLSDFQTVKFKVQGVTGDIGYKNVVLVASNTTFSGSLDTANVINANWYNSGWPTDGCFQGGPQFNQTTLLDTSVTIVKSKADAFDGSTVYFSLYEAAAAASGGGDATVFTFSDIEFEKGSGAVVTAPLNKIAIARNSDPNNNVIEGLPTKTTYAPTDTFDPAGLRIQADYLYTPASGYREYVAYNETTKADFAFSAGGSTLTPGTSTFSANTTITITYKTKTTTFDITSTSAPPPAEPYTVDLTEATSSLTSGNLATQYSGYSVEFPALTGFDVSKYKYVDIKATFEDYDGSPITATWGLGGVKLGPSPFDDDAKYADISNLGVTANNTDFSNASVHYQLTSPQKTALAAISTSGWVVYLQKNDAATSGTGVSKITLTEVKFHNND